MNSTSGALTTTDWMRAAAPEPVDLRTDRPHSARIYDYLLGGRTNYAADREQARKLLRRTPEAVSTARENRAFMHRAVRVLAQERGIRQFLDIGTGIPTSPNLHEVAQGVDPSARVVYVDNDPIVLTHSRALHASSREGATAYLEADAADPAAILASRELRETLDLGRPVAVTLLALLHWLPPHCDPYTVVRTLADAVPPGSALAVTYVTTDFDETLADIEDEFQGTGSTVRTRTRAEVEPLFDGFELLDPGLVPPQRWRPDVAEARPRGRELPGSGVALWAGVGVKSGN